MFVPVKRNPPIKPEDIGYTISHSIRSFTNPRYVDICHKLAKYQELLGVEDISKTLYELSTIEKKIKFINDISHNPQSLMGDIPYLLKQLKKIEKAFHQIKPIDPKDILIRHNKGIEIPKFLDLEYIKKIQDIISPLHEIEDVSGIGTKPTTIISEVSDEISKEGGLSFEKIIALISLLISLLSAYPALKELYKDFTYDPITAICGVLSDLEKEAVKFVEVDNRGGIPLYQYPTGKKSEHYLIDGTQICMVTQPKGNAKRVKVIYQVENHTQIMGYVDRNKLKRLYKMD